MEMYTKNESTRVGIYTQKSVEAATTGDGFAPQGEKSPVAEIKTQQDFPYELNQLQRSGDMNQSQNEEVRRCKQDRNVRKFINRRFGAMRRELKKFNFSRGELAAMEVSLEAEYKKSYNYLKIVRIAYRDEHKTPHERKADFLVNRRRRSSSFKSEERSRSRFGDKYCDKQAIWRQTTTSLKKGDFEKVYTSPSFANSEKRSNHDRSRDRLNWENRSPDQRYSPFGSERDRSRSPFNMTRRDDEFEEFRRKMGLPGNDYEDRLLYSDQDSSQPSLSTFNSSHNTENKKCKLVVQILNKADPFGLIPEEIQSLMLETVQKTLEIESAIGTRQIVFGDIDFKKGILHVRCGNQHTVCFLEQKVPLLNQFIPNVNLYVSRKKIYKTVKVFVNNFNLTTEEFFKIIKKQNDYPTECWKEYHRQGDTENMYLLLGVDLASYERLKREGGHVYYFLKQLSFQLDSK